MNKETYLTEYPKHESMRENVKKDKNRLHFDILSLLVFLLFLPISVLFSYFDSVILSQKYVCFKDI